MSAQRTGVVERRSLARLGISEPEERLYRWLLKHRGASVSEAAHSLPFTPERTRCLIESLEVKGLATYTPEKPRKFIPTSPDVGLGSLLMQRQNDLQDVQIAIKELQDDMATEQQEEREHVVELITSREAERQAFEQMSRLAQNEVLGLVKPPLRSSHLNAPIKEEHPIQEEAKNRGVRYRSIVDTEFMALPGAVTRIRETILWGGEFRMFAELPFKMVISDRKIALVPLSLESVESPSLLIKSSALLDALCVLFDFIWERASPLLFSGQKGLKTVSSGAQLEEQTRDLISLMASGLNDKSIFMDLGISRSTHQKRLKELMNSLNARTRFQAGWLAALRFSTDGFLETNNGEGAEG